MPRMPRTGKEIQEQLITIKKFIPQNPADRCLTAIYMNIAVFIIGYTILFTYNIYCYFRYRRGWAAEANGQMIFKLNHSTDDLNLPRKLSSAIRNVAIIAPRQASIRSPISPMKTILEKGEMIRDKAVEKSTAKRLSINGSNKGTGL
ncbi:hypothetical protein LOAG_02356 [Loa loa]|uniref:Uncharacterized protein n=1 Tax=Loa loa TaxID=7209 RepID=A0A1S0U6M3_LOALO|nr:hypothetical protein LOAG_02356 [Loa loa]EFO26122.2 hypothetical protein LOAG_02356 [Loa loa]